MRITIIDTETTGVDKENDTVIEIAAIHVDISAGEIVSSYATLLHHPTNPAIHVNRISEAALSSPFAFRKLITPIAIMIEDSDYIIAHNKEFDKPFVDRLFASDEYQIKIPWICTVREIAFPHEYSGKHVSATAKLCRKLSHLASDYSISAAGAHRALADCMILANLLLMIEKNGPNSLQSQINRAMAPKFWYQAVVKHPREDDGASKDLAKSLGFRWDAKNLRWLKLVGPEDVKTLPFQAIRLAEADVPFFE